MSVNMPPVAARPFAAPRPFVGIGASAVALLLCLFWNPLWMAPLLVTALCGVWIYECRRLATPSERPFGWCAPA